MKLSKIAQSSGMEDKTFLLLLLLVSLAFFWVLWPFYGAVFWGAIFAGSVCGVRWSCSRRRGQRRRMPRWIEVLGVSPF